MVPEERAVYAARRSLEGGFFDNGKAETMKVRNTALGMRVGLIWGVTVLLATLWVAVFGDGNVPDPLRRLYIGDSVSIGSATVGLIYGLADGFLFGWLFAWLCNRLSGSKASSQSRVNRYPRQAEKIFVPAHKPDQSPAGLGGSTSGRHGR